MAEWPSIQLGEVATVRSGFAFSSQAWTDEGVSVVRIGNIKRGVLDLTGCARVTSQLARLTGFLLQPDDIVIAMTGYIGDSAWVRKSDLPAVVNQRVGLFSVTDRICRRFLFYVLQSDLVRLEITHRGYGSAQPNISPSLIHSVPIPLPPLSQQRAIAEVLGALDDKIEANQRTRIVASSLVKRDFDRMVSPCAGALDDPSLLRSGWGIGTLGDWLSVLETGRRPKGGVSQYSDGVPSIGAESIVGLALYDYAKTRYVPADFFSSMGRGVIQSRDVLLYKDGGRPGEFEPHVSMFGYGFPFDACCINEHVYRMRASEPLTQEYLYCWLSSEPLLEEMRRSGTGVAIPGLNSTAVKALPILIPPAGVVEEFNGAATDLVHLCLAAAAESQDLAQLRNALLPRLLSGEVRVRNAEDLVSDAV